MTPVRRTALSVAAAAAVWIASVVLAVIVGASPAGAQAPLAVAATCEDTTLRFDWQDASLGSAQIEVWYGDPPYTIANRDHQLTLTIVTGNRTGVRRFTVPLGTSGFARMTVIADGSDVTQASAEFTCTISDVAQTLVLADILAELETIDSRLTNVNRNVQMTTTNVADVEVLLASTNETLAVIAASQAAVETALTDTAVGVPALLAGLDAKLASVAASADATADMASRTAARVAHTETVANQNRNQTHALLALVAIMFALWLRPIFRSRKTAS